MANLTKTWKTQTLNVFAPTPSTRWQAFNWGTGTWGYKSAGAGGLPAIAHGFSKVWSGNNAIPVTCPTANLSKRVSKIWTGTNQTVVVYANSDKELGTGNGYNYQVVDRVTNIESAAASAAYTSLAVAGFTYTSQAVQTTTWS